MQIKNNEFLFTFLKNKILNFVDYINQANIKTEDTRHHNKF